MIRDKKFIPIKKRLEKYSKRMRIDMTPEEAKFERILYKLKLKYISQKYYFCNAINMIVDFYLPKPLNIVYEIDGKQHLNGYTAVRDRVKEKFLRIHKNKVYRIDNEQINKRESEVYKDIIITIYMRMLKNGFMHNTQELKHIINKMFHGYDIEKKIKQYNYIMLEAVKIAEEREIELFKDKIPVLYHGD